MIETAAVAPSEPTIGNKVTPPGLAEPRPTPPLGAGGWGLAQEASDGELMVRVRGGDSAAFALLYERHKGWVVALAYRFCGDRDLAMDVLQETFAFLLKRSPTLTLDGRLTTYLFPAVRNLSQTARRKKLRFGGGEVVEHRSETGGTGHRSETGGIGHRSETGGIGHRSETGATQDDDEELRRVVAGLPEGQRELIYMRYVAGMTPTEIAVVLGVPVGTAKSRLFAAVRAVEAGLGKLDADGV